LATWNKKKFRSSIFAACHRHDKASFNRVVIKTKKEDIPAKNEGYVRPKMMTSFILTCFKRQISKYTVLATADLKVSLSELSSLGERSSGALFIAFYGSFWVEKVSKKSLNLPTEPLISQGFIDFTAKQLKTNLYII
jgi:hypothetical protein